ncbi:recombinase family protein [Serratia sp. SRS-8-S-2018]|uniref:recombinase family protein n=1 Tax=Serratia sp. SRS-8-S-2018 TaxID=2591107 RepID=UPI00210612D1|nr:recombinase family protein [Serratia sp. SRS-8-S-2018]
MLQTSQQLEMRQINLVSLRENIDTCTATGRGFLSMMGGLHQMERELKAERAAARRAAAKARGKNGGRPRTDVDRLENAQILYENADKTAAEVCELAGVGRRTFFSYLQQHREGISGQEKITSKHGVD